MRERIGKEKEKERMRDNCSVTGCMLLLIDDLMYLHVTSQDQLFVSNRVPLQTLEKCHVALKKIFEKDTPSQLIVIIWQMKNFLKFGM